MNRKQIKQLKDNRNALVTTLTIGPYDGHARTKTKAAEMAVFAQAHHQRRSPERLMKNAMLSVLYRMEYYLQNDQVTPDHICGIEDFVKDFLIVLKINKTTFAQLIEVNGANLNKYYRSERRFNTELALKFAHFFHTPPDLWLRIQIKNELLLLQEEKQSDEKYTKYDYEKLLQIA
jgi:plasmid maintenance system antidote protein VapI